MRKRSAYKPRPIAVPLTSGLVQMFRAETTRADLMFRLRTPGTEAFNCAGDIFDTCGQLIVEKLPEYDPDTIAIRSAVLALVAARKRFKGGDVILNETDAESVSRGLQAIEQHLSTLRVMDLYHQHQKVMAHRAQDLKDAINKEAADVQPH